LYEYEYEYISEGVTPKTPASYGLASHTRSCMHIHERHRATQPCVRETKHRHSADIRFDIESTMGLLPVNTTATHPARPHSYCCINNYLYYLQFVHKLYMACCVYFPSVSCRFHSL